MTIEEFVKWLANLRVARTIMTIQQHHTAVPDYSHVRADNHFEVQRNMRNYHVNTNGWNDIGQQFSTFPDGMILTGRSMERSPACILGQNANAVCIENVGNFDAGKDVMTALQRETIVRMTAALCVKFNLPVNANSIVYHHWFDLSTGERNDGTANNKSCPGTAFFGGNKTDDCRAHFLPLVNAEIQRTGAGAPAVTGSLLKYVCVVADKLNVRVKPDPKSEKAKDREAAALGAILRVYREKNGWYKISDTKQHWVSGKFCVDVKRATVRADVLNVRSGPGTTYSTVGSLKKGQEIFVTEKNGWCEVSMGDKWVSSTYLTFN